MKGFTEKRRQWLWFGLLWCAGLGAAFALATLARWVASVG
jgi:hypothetical protein